MCMGSEILAVISIIFYAAVTIILLLVVYPFRATEIRRSHRWSIAAGGVIILILGALCLRAGILMSSIEPKVSVSRMLSPDFARYLIENYYFPLGVSVFLLLAVFLGGYLAVGRAGR